MRERVFRWVIATPTFIAAFILIIHLTFVFVWPLESITDVRMMVLDDVVSPGDAVHFKSHVCKHVPASSELRYGLTSKTERRYFDAGMEYGNNPTGCFDIIQHFNVPVEIPPGDYEAFVIAIIEVNGLRTDVYRLRVGDVRIVRGQ